MKYWAELVEEAEESGCPSIINNKDQTLENRELDRPDNHKVTIQDKNCWQERLRARGERGDRG